MPLPEPFQIPGRQCSRVVAISKGPLGPTTPREKNVLAVGYIADSLRDRDEMMRATQTQPRSESAGLLVDTLAYLWPNSEVSFVRRRGHLDGRSFVAVPSI